MVFTATLGQDFWRCALEEIGSTYETLKTAKKMHVTMYDCLKYEDGKRSIWSHKKIMRIKSTCKSESEMNRRVMGRFVKDDRLKYPSFSREMNVITPIWDTPPKDWLIFTGIDIGGGGAGHPAAICFIAIRPDYRYGVVFKGWKGQGELTTATDIMDRYRNLRGKLRPILQCYDTASKDFFTIASRMGECFTPAEKGRDIGEDTINVLFKNKMLSIFNLTELEPLMSELASLTNDKDKSHARDDYSDALRYALTRIPWDWSFLHSDEEEITVKSLTETEEINRKRRELVEGKKEEKDIWGVDQEMEAWNELLEG